MRRALSFTLTEVIVVISIVIALLALLLPSLRNARRHARTVVCMTRMRTLTETTQLYVADFERFPPSLMNTPGQWLFGWVGFDWLGVGHRGDGRGVAPRRGLYWRYVGVTEPFACPEDAASAQPDSVRLSYAMNGRTGLLRPGAYTRHREKPDLPRLSDAALPTLFEEAAPAEGCFSGRDLPDHRHLGRTNVGFADGHVADRTYSAGTNANGISRELMFDPPLDVVEWPDW